MDGCAIAAGFLVLSALLFRLASSPPPGTAQSFPRSLSEQRATPPCNPPLLTPYPHPICIAVLCHHSNLTLSALIVARQVPGLRLSSEATHPEEYPCTLHSHSHAHTVLISFTSSQRVRAQGGPQPQGAQPLHPDLSRQLRKYQSSMVCKGFCSATMDRLAGNIGAVCLPLELAPQ